MPRRLPAHVFHRRIGRHEPVVVADDLTTWPSSGTFTTAHIPAGWTEELQDGVLVPVQNDLTPFYLVFDCTKILSAAALADVHGLRFTTAGGVKLGHIRTPGGRILIGGTFTPGGPIVIRYYWGKSGTSQPGNGFPSALSMLAPCRLALIFEGGTPLDISPNPAPFTKIGAPTFYTGPNGQAMTCGDGNYIQTDAAKLRGSARDNRTAMALTRIPETNSAGRVICWGNWLTNNRGFQLFTDLNYVELYIDDDGVSPFQKWSNAAPFASGWTFIGGSWQANVATAIVQRDGDVLVDDRDLVANPVPGPIHNTPDPYIIGGTPQAGIYHAGDVAEVFELFAPSIPHQHVAWDMAWRTNEQFLGFDRTPNAFDVPDVTGQPINSEVAFASVVVTGISPGTAISVSGDGAPTYAISSAIGLTGDVKAKGSTPGTIDPGRYVRSWHTGSAAYQTTTTSNLTIGTLTSARKSTTIPTPGSGGGSGIPEGAATYTVNTLADGQAVINNQLAPGQILEFADGIYPGTLLIERKNWSGGAKAVIRAANHAYRGPHPSQGGLWVDGETTFAAGSKGAEFSGLKILDARNFVLEGIRLYKGAGMHKAWDQIIGYAYDAVFRNCRFAGLRASGYPDKWLPDISDHSWTIDLVPQGLQLKELINCRFEKCLFQYLIRGTYQIGGSIVFSECCWQDMGGDFYYTGYENQGTRFEKCVTGRVFPSTTAWHCDSFQCTAFGYNALVGTVWDLCLLGPGNSSYPHQQGVFLEQDNSANLGPNGCIVKNTLIECRPANGIYMRPALNCQAVNVTMIQNQFSGIDSARRNTTFPTPQINMNPNGLSRGGNKIDKCVGAVFTIGTMPGDAVTNSYVLAPAAYPTHLFDYPLHSEGLWRPTMILNEKCAVNTTELKRMAPKLTAPFHPDTADRGAWRLFDHYGVLP